MTEITLVEAISLALARAMSDDSSVVLLGQDIGRNGGVFRVTEGLLSKFGEHRVIDTPLAETVIAGTAVGMAAGGLRPVAEIQFMGFIYSTMDQLINHAARLRNRTRGRLTCPMVLRAPFGAGIHAPEHHSESMEALFAHVPGLRVVVPSSPAHAYGLLLAAIHNPDPVVFLEPKRIYRTRQEVVADDGGRLPLDRCFVLREGVDITLVSWGAMLVDTLAAADALAQRGYQAEVVDVATLKPLDMPTIAASVKKTGRAVIIHEAPASGGFGAEIAARLAENQLADLLAPVGRVAGFDTLVPLPRLEDLYLPDSGRIVDAALTALQYR